MIMKTVLVLVVVGLVLYSATLFAGEYLMNDTGQMVYGLQVTFSEPVTITGYGDVLMTVEPSGESTTFTFSGETVDAWNGIWFNWEPSSAVVVLHEWLTEIPSDPVGGAGWERLYGPPGGYVETLAISPSDPSIIYGTGSDEGIYKTTGGGLRWWLIPFDEPTSTSVLVVDPNDPQLIYSGHNGLSRSRDGGLTWQCIAAQFQDEYEVRHLAFAPDNPGALYLAIRKYDQSAISVLRSGNQGDSWAKVGVPPAVPQGADVTGFAVQNSGLLAMGINDFAYRDWRCGRLFISTDGGAHWQETNYGNSEPRFIWSVFANPFSAEELWVSEGPLYNAALTQPLIYRSEDRGKTWTPVRFSHGGYDSTQVRVIGASSSGAVYVAAGGSLYVTEDAQHLRNITPPHDRMTGVDYFDIAVHPQVPEILYLPLRSSGIAYSEDGGQSWARRDQGISSISVNLLEADPFSAATVYASSVGGQGFFRSDDYGFTWSHSLAGIVHPFGDEIDPDPHNEGTVWFVADVPYVFRSKDFGETWSVVADPKTAGRFNFCSIYAIAQGTSRDRIYVVDNGFGIFRGTNGYESGNWDWWFLRDSEVDYTYSLAVDPNDEDLIYSGFSRKLFQDSAMVRASYDGGDSWVTSLLIPGAEAVTSVVVDPTSSANLYAAATSSNGGSVWTSEDRGATWSQPNPEFTFTTIHSYAVASNDSMIAYAGSWGGGTYKTMDGGVSWELLEDPRVFSAAGIVIGPEDDSHIYIADRSSPCLYESTDGGTTFQTLVDAAPDYSRLMSVTVDPNDPTCVYVSAMRGIAPGEPPGLRGALLRVTSGNTQDITNGLPRLPLWVTVSSADSKTLFAVIHGYGVYRSRDRGETWEDISGDDSGLPFVGFSSLIVDPDNCDTLYLVGGCDVRFATCQSAELSPSDTNAIYRSCDGGDTWKKLGGEFFGERTGTVKALAFYKATRKRLLAAAENGLFVSDDDGKTWAEDQTLPYSTLGGISVAGNALLAMTNGGGVYRGWILKDGQIQWETEPCVTAEIFFAQIVKDPVKEGTVFSSAYPGGVFKSLDSGMTWHEANFGLPSFAVEDPLRQGYYALAISPSAPNVLYLGLYGEGVYRSDNGADTWIPANGSQWEMGSRKITSLAIDPTDSDRVFVASEDGVFRTDDGGASWQETQTGLATRDVKIVYFAPNGALYAGTHGYGLFTWKQNCRWEAQSPVGQWGVIWPIWDDRPRYQYTDILFHPTDPNRLLIGTFPAGIYSSQDGGDAWRESNIGWTQDGVFFLVSHPEQPEVVFAGTYNGINRSLDFGEHWELWDTGWPDEQWVFTIAFDPGDPDIMYACSKNGENEGAGRKDFHGTVMKSIDGGQNWFSISEDLPIDNEFYDMIVDPLDSDTIYLAAQHDGMFISRDGGDTWASWNEGLRGSRWFPWNEGLHDIVPATNGNNVTRMLALSGDCRYIYFGSYEAGVFRREIHPPDAP